MHPLSNGNCGDNKIILLSNNDNSDNDSYADTETETFRSALNSHNTTQNFNSNEDEATYDNINQSLNTLNLTIENVKNLTANAEQIMMENAELQANISAQLQQVNEAMGLKNTPATNVKVEDDDAEPMDVDMSFNAQANLNVTTNNEKLNSNDGNISNNHITHDALNSEGIAEQHVAGDSGVGMNISQNQNECLKSDLNSSTHNRSTFSIHDIQMDNLNKTSNNDANNSKNNVSMQEMNSSKSNRSTFNVAEAEHLAEQAHKPSNKSFSAAEFQPSEDQPGDLNKSANKRGTFSVADTNLPNIDLNSMTNKRSALYVTTDNEIAAAGDLNSSSNKRSTFSINEAAGDLNCSSKKRETFSVVNDIINEKPAAAGDLNSSSNKRGTFSVVTIDDNQQPKNKRDTFSLTETQNLKSAECVFSQNAAEIHEQNSLEPDMNAQNHPQLTPIKMEDNANLSLSSAQATSAPVSPSFPSMQPIQLQNQFPTSPHQAIKKKEIFLEAAAKQEADSTFCNSPNITFDAKNMKSPAAMKSQNNTFCKTSNNTFDHSDSPQQQQKQNQLNTSYTMQEEPMDVDASFATPAATPASKSFALPTKAESSEADLMPPPAAAELNYPLQLKRPALHESASNKAIKNLQQSQQEPLSPKEKAQQQLHAEKDFDQVACSSNIDDMFGGAVGNSNGDNATFSNEANEENSAVGENEHFEDSKNSKYNSFICQYCLK